MRKLQTFCKACACALVGLGIACNLGWRFDSPFLTSGAPGFPGMSPLIGICLVLMGLALVCLAEENTSARRRAAGQSLALAIILLASLQLASGNSILDWSLNDILFQFVVGKPASIAMQMPATAAFSLVGAGCALLALDNHLGKNWYPSQSLALVVGLNALLVLSTYSSAVPIYGFEPTGELMPLPCALAMLAFALGLLAARPHHGFMSLLTARGFGSTLVRRLIFVALVVPIFFGLVAIDSLRSDILSPREAIDILIFAVMVFLISSLLLAAKALQRAAKQRDAAESNVERQQGFLRNVIDSVPNFIFIKDWNGRFVLANRATAEAYGTTVENLLGKTDADFNSSVEEVAFFVEKDRETMRSGKPVLIDAEKVTDAQGNTRWVTTYKTPIKSIDGEEVQVLGASADITRLKQIEGELLESQKQLSRTKDELSEQNTVLERIVRERTRALEQAQAEMLKRLAIASEFRDDDTGEHTNRVSELSGLLAEVLGLPEREVELIRSAAALHDLGKIGISDRIFLKPGKLTPDEFEIMKSHTLIASKILGGSPSPLLQMAEIIALTHHEKWDGTGYPHGLQGDEIPLAGRVVAVADVFDALTHARPYKHAWNIDAAVEEIKRLSGTSFDPKVVDAFITLMGGESKSKAA